MKKLYKFLNLKIVPKYTYLREYHLKSIRNTFKESKTLFASMNVLFIKKEVRGYQWFESKVYMYGYWGTE